MHRDFLTLITLTTFSNMLEKFHCFCTFTRGKQTIVHIFVMFYKKSGLILRNLCARLNLCTRLYDQEAVVLRWQYQAEQVVFGTACI